MKIPLQNKKHAHLTTLKQPYDQLQSALQTLKVRARRHQDLAHDGISHALKRAWHNCKCHTTDVLENGSVDVQLIQHRLWHAQLIWEAWVAEHLEFFIFDFCGDG
jgi:hypothetical protein